MATDRQCWNCTFMERDGRGDLECHFHAPVPRPHMTSETHWPIVSASDWCGQFQPTAEGEPGIAKLRAALERIARYPWDNPESEDATIVGVLARSALLPP